jgi:methyl-accepting chemotaxis protein
LLADHNRQLEESIGAIQQVHARVARGDLGVRAAIRSGDPLLHVASSLNLTLDRLARGTLSTAALTEVEHEMRVLHDYLADLAHARLQKPVPSDQLRRLAPLAFGLEQLRASLFQAIQSTRTLTEQVGRDTQVVNDHVQRLEATFPAEPELAPQLRRDVEALYADIARLYQHVGQFL